MTEAQFDEVVNVHFKGVYFLTQKLLPVMNDGGRLVNIFIGPDTLLFSREFCIRSRKRSRRGSDPLPGQGTRTACDHRKCGRAGRDSD
jgi:hypothetical protein